MGVGDIMAKGNNSKKNNKKNSNGLKKNIQIKNNSYNIKNDIQ